jgi:ABC-type transport system substrate-binding protein
VTGRKLAALAFAFALVAATGAAAQQKVLRVAYLSAETNFDPAFVSDIYSNYVNIEIFEAPLTYDFLARPAKLKPLTLESMPEVSDGGRTYVLRLRKGIYFADDPAFGGRKRELTAHDYEFAFKRLMDPKVASPNLWLIEGRVAGIEEAVMRARKSGRFDYDAPVAGLEPLDRYTLRVRLVNPDYNFLYILAMTALGAQAREVVERYAGDIGAHPVGTGPYRLAAWKRSSRIVLERNPEFREEYWDAEPPLDDPISQQLYRENKGKRIPQIDRVEISIVEESQPRWLAFLNKELDWINVPLEFINMAMPAGKLAPWLAKRAVRYVPDVDPDVVYLYFNMRDPVVGGYTPDRIALRRAISLAYDNSTEINILRNGNGIEAESPVPPGVLGYDPRFNLGETHDPAKAKALLDMFGFVDRDGDGWRDMPDGSPLVMVYATEPTQINRQFSELWRKCLADVGIRMEVDVAKWPEHRKQSKLGKLQTWQLSWNADYPDGENFYQLLYGPNCGTSNDGCFQLAGLDDLYRKAAGHPPGPERTGIYQQMARIVAAYAPWKLNVHRKRNQMIQPWVLGWRKHPFLGEAYEYADIDVGVRAKSIR